MFELWYAFLLVLVQILWVFFFCVCSIGYAYLLIALSFHIGYAYGDQGILGYYDCSLGRGGGLLRLRVCTKIPSCLLIIKGANVLNFPASAH